MPECPRVGLSLARLRAVGLCEKLGPYVQRIEIVGSIRREKPLVGDIEILLEPKTREASLFGDREPVIEPIRRTLSRFGALTKNGDRYIRVTGTEPGAIPVDVFLVHPPATWGTLQAIRTGPAELSRYCVTRLRYRGWRCVGGRVLRPAPAGATEGAAVIGGRMYEQVPTNGEEAFFAACDVPFVPPQERSQMLVRLVQGLQHSNGARE